MHKDTRSKLCKMYTCESAIYSVCYVVKGGPYMMAVSEAKKAANRRWDEANRGRYWRATIVFPIEEKEQVMKKAARRGMILSEYIRDLIEKDKAGTE